VPAAGNAVADVNRAAENGGLLGGAAGCDFPGVPLEPVRPEHTRATIKEVRPTTTTAIRRWFIGLLVGSAITSLPWLVSKLDFEALWPINLVMIPGILVAIVSAGNVHTYNELVLLIANTAFYAAGTYLVLRLRHK
jgi:hypothetical protein